MRGSCMISQDKECWSDEAPSSFEPWVKPQLTMDVDTHTALAMGPSSIMLRVASSRLWDWIYLTSFLSWSILRPVSQLLPVLEPFVTIPLGVMVLVAALGLLLALYFCMRQPELINNARREEKRFWVSK